MLTEKQVSDLNRMNVASQRANLGNMVKIINERASVVSVELNASDISNGVATIAIVDDYGVPVSHAVILSYSVTAADGTVRAVTKAVVTGTNALLTVTSVIATDIVHIIYTK